MINEIERRKRAGEKVELECVDRQSFINDEINSHSNIQILDQESLVVKFIDYRAERIILDGAVNPVIDNAINFNELKYFKIKERKPNFDDLVDKTIKAVRDCVAIITHLELDNITIESINYDLLSPLEICREDAPEKIQKAIDWIDSLYTETFVIDDVSDVLNCKRGARLVFSNGVESEFLESYFGGLRAEILFLDSGKCCNVPIELLKGSTVTQKRGKA